MTTPTDALWQRYREHAEPEVRAELIGQHVGLVHHIVRQIASRVGDAVSFDDLMGAGMVGLVVAFEGFDPTRNIAFTTYATQRIRGTVLDELRAADPRTRLIRTRAREIQSADRALNRVLGRAPTAEEVAAQLGIDVETYWDWHRVMNGPTTIGLDAPAGTGERNTVIADIIPAPNTPRPDADLLRDEWLAEIRSAIATLPEQQRTVLALCYFEELTLRQIAEILHVTESRISQVRTAAINALRDLLDPEDFQEE